MFHRNIFFFNVLQTLPFKKSFRNWLVFKTLGTIMAENASEVSSIKSKANSLMKSGKFLEAIMEYSRGIALQPSNAILYSNRSLAFLKLSQYFFAIKDAETAIRLVPEWPKGYYRKGQAEYGAESYGLALATFESGLSMCPGDETLTKAAADAKAKQQEFEAMKYNTRIKYTVFASVVCTLVIIADIFAHPYEAIIRRTWLRPVLVLIAGALGYLVACLVLAFQQASRQTLLDPPLELLQHSDTEKSANQSETKVVNHTFSKAKQS